MDLRAAPSDHHRATVSSAGLEVQGHLVLALEDRGRSSRLVDLAISDLDLASWDPLERFMDKDIREWATLWVRGTTRR
jgi:hypothetical protein